jgi:hypothetical protein
MGMITIISSGDLIRFNGGIKDVNASLDAWYGVGKYFFINLFTTAKPELISH